ncbi:MAG: hypothetical protein WKG01_33040 [Kofleriaceae bacterium]
MTIKHSLLFVLAAAALGCGGSKGSSGTNTSPARAGETPSTYPTTTEAQKIDGTGAATSDTDEPKPTDPSVTPAPAPAPGPKTP